MKRMLHFAVLCGLSMSLHAGWRDWVRSIPSWKKEGTQEQKDALLNSAKKWGCGAAAGLGISALHVAAATTVTYCYNKAYENEIYGDCTPTAFIVANQVGRFLWPDFDFLTFPSFIFLNSSSSWPYEESPLKTAMKALFSSKDPINLTFAVSTIAGLACAAKAGYDCVQAQRIQTNENV